MKLKSNVEMMIALFFSILSTLPFASAARHGLRFLAIGDWGGTDEHPYYTEGQWATAQGLASVAAGSVEANSTAASFVLSLGDNFYPYGLPDSAHGVDLRFQNTFEKVYYHQELQVPWYILVGNHDYRGNIAAQLEYGQNPSTRWVYPEYNYRVVKEIALDDGGPPIKLEIIMIDTNRLDYSNFEEEFPDVTLSAGKPGADEAAATLDWINSTLHESDADYLMVAGHNPIYSPCHHGSTHHLIAELDPLLKEHAVSAYLSGHEHCHFHFAHEKMSYLTTGTGHTCCYKASNKHTLPDLGELKYLLADSEEYSGSSGIQGGFTSFDVGRDEMTVAFHDQDGISLNEAVIMPRRVVKRKMSLEGNSLSKVRQFLRIKVPMKNATVAIE